MRVTLTSFAHVFWLYFAVSFYIIMWNRFWLCIIQLLLALRRSVFFSVDFVHVAERFDCVAECM